MKSLYFGVAAAAAALIGAAPAQAARTFTLNGVQFSDGTAITGSFTTDDAVTTVGAFSIKTSAGSTVFSDMTFTSAGNYVASLATSSVTFSEATGTGTFVIFPTSLTLSFLAPLSANANASISGGSESAFIFSRSVASGGTAIVSAGAVAVPEPATWAIMVLGMGAVGAAMRRRAQVRMRVAYA